MMNSFSEIERIALITSIDLSMDQLYKSAVDFSAGFERESEGVKYLVLIHSKISAN